MNLLELFTTLSVEMVERFVGERQEEHLSLDFKTAGHDFTSGGDKRNFAEVLSGFSNSAGGIVVWGVATQKDKNGNDVATQLKPIAAIDAFVARLQEFTPLLVSPANADVAHRALRRADGSGFAATFVPESVAGPHMALGGHDRYFKRAGDRFYRMEHFDVADMFGRRQRASLEVAFDVSGGVSLQGPDGTKRRVHVAVNLTNVGRASVAAPFVRLHTDEPFEIRRYGTSSRAHGEAQFEAFPDGSRTLALVASATVLLHPKMTLPVAEIASEIWDHVSLPSCNVEFAHAAMDLPLKQGVIRFRPEDLAVKIGRGVAPGRQ